MPEAPNTAHSGATDALNIAGTPYSSRLLVGTGKYRDFEQTRQAVEASGAQIVTVAVRRTNLGQEAGAPNLLDVLDPARYTILPNTAGWRGSCWTVPAWSSSRCWVTPRPCTRMSPPPCRRQKHWWRKVSR